MSKRTEVGDLVQSMLNINQQQKTKMIAQKNEMEQGRQKIDALKAQIDPLVAITAPFMGREDLTDDISKVIESISIFKTVLNQKEAEQARFEMERQELFSSYNNNVIPNLKKMRAEFFVQTNKLLNDLAAKSNAIIANDLNANFPVEAFNQLAQEELKLFGQIDAIQRINDFLSDEIG